MCCSQSISHFAFRVQHFPLNPHDVFDDSTGMFPMSALLSHAELTRRKTSNKQAVDARRSRRCTRHGNLTLFPRVEIGIAEDSSFDDLTDPPRVIASISNVSTTGVGLILSEELPDGLEFDVEWPESKTREPLRFEVVHSKPVSGGMYRTGARLVAGELPPEPVSSNFVNQEQPDENASNESMSISSTSFTDGILKYEADIPAPTNDRMNPAPQGTLRVASAFGFDKTEKLDGVTTCGWERSISMRREGDRLWVYIHSPGKKNGWGLYVDAEQFEAAFERVQQSASSPFISTLAA
jgi:hypothetical protein